VERRPGPGRRFLLLKISTVVFHVLFPEGATISSILDFEFCIGWFLSDVWPYQTDLSTYTDHLGNAFQD